MYMKDMHMTDLDQISTCHVSAPSGSPLLSLPLELVEEIAQVVADRNDLLALRLSCIHVSESVKKTFLKVYFTTLKHHWTKKSLDTLVEITSHHDYASYVRHIMIGTRSQNRDPVRFLADKVAIPSQAFELNRTIDDARAQCAGWEDSWELEKGESSVPLAQLLVSLHDIGIIRPSGCFMIWQIMRRVALKCIPSVRATQAIIQKLP